MVDYWPVVEIPVHPQAICSRYLTEKENEPDPIPATVYVSGTSFRQSILKKLAVKLGKDFFTAQLVVDKNNPFDPRAIAVFSGAFHVGYISAKWLNFKYLYTDLGVLIKEPYTRYNHLSDNIEALKPLPATCMARLVLPQLVSGSIGVRVFLKPQVYRKPGKPETTQVPYTINLSTSPVKTMKQAGKNASITFKSGGSIPATTFSVTDVKVYLGDGTFYNNL